MDNEAYTSDQLRHIAEGLDNANSGCERLAGIFYAAAKADKAHHSLQQAEPVADDELVSVPSCLIGSACHAIEHGRPAPNTLKELRRYTTGYLNSTSPALPAGQWVKEDVVKALYTLANQIVARGGNQPLDGDYRHVPGIRAAAKYLESLPAAPDSPTERD